MMKNKETWIDIKGYEGLYKVSDLGRIYSVKNSLILKPTLSGKYYTVTLYKYGKRKTFTVHYCVLNSFIQKTSNEYTVDHINRDTHDNRLLNLRWCTKYEQEQNKEIPIKKVICSNGEIYNSIHEASRKLNLHASKICAVCKGKRKSTGGYKFQYS